MCEYKSYKLSFLVTSYKDGDAWILYNWTNTQNLIVDDRMHPLYDFLDHRRSKILYFTINGDDSDFKYLLENAFIVESDQETVEYVETQYRIANSENVLDLILMPVNQACNFDCVYCYEDHSMKHRMGAFDAESILNFIKSYNLSKLGIDYFGGEPLLNSDFIISFNKSVIEYSMKKAIDFTSSMTTNGYLLSPELLLKLLDVKVNNFQISIDGVESDHNYHRPLKNGKGSFDKIYNNLVEISHLSEHYEFMIIVRVNFSEKSSSYEKQDKFLKKLKDDIGNDNRFVVNPHVIVNWKGHKDQNNALYMPISKGMEVENEYRNTLRKHKLNPFNMINYSGLESNSCYADKKNTFVIFPSSSSSSKNILPVQKCTIGIFDNFNSIGHINNNGKLYYNNNINKWLTKSPFKKDECRSCFFVLNCYGSACPLNTIRSGFVKCPDEKFKEVEIVKEIMSFIHSAS